MKELREYILTILKIKNNNGMKILFEWCPAKRLKKGVRDHNGENKSRSQFKKIIFTP